MMMVAQLYKYTKKIEFYCVDEPNGYVNYIWGKLLKRIEAIKKYGIFCLHFTLIIWILNI